MATPSAHTGLAPTVAYREVLSDDGTRLRAWTNDPEGRLPGPTVLLCNGLGANPFHWPALLRAEPAVRVVSWNHRGIGGSDRPHESRRVRIGSFVEDALSVMDHFALERPVVVGWSVGVHIAVELAVGHPERVAGILAVAGVPGDAFASTLGPLRIPRVATRAATASLAHGLRLGGWALSPLTTRFPFGPRSLEALRRSGFVGSVADPELAGRAFAEMLTTPVQWYMHLALGTARSTHAPLGRIAVPSTFVAGTRDLLVASRDVAATARRVPGAHFVELRSSHFVPLEHPDLLHGLLLDVIARVEQGD